MRPSLVYILGTAGDAFSQALYTVGKAVFLWHFLGDDNLLSAGLIATAFSFFFFFEAIMEVVSSFAADRWGLSRRKVFLTGILLPTICFVVLSLHPFWIADTTLAMLAFAISQFLFATSITLISGTFDGWSITAELSQDSSFSKAKFFSLATIAKRLAYSLGCLLIVIVLFVMEASENPNVKGIWWTRIWIFAVIFQMMLFVLLYHFSRGHDSVQKAGPLPAWAPMLHATYQPSALPGLVLYCSMYLLGMVVTVSWPTLVDVVGPRPLPYLIAPALTLVGFFGAMWAKRVTKRSSDQAAEQHALKGALHTCYLLIGAGLCLSFSQERGMLPLIAVAFVILMRLPFYFGFPFVLSLMHENIGGSENVRACVVSLRTATASLFVGVAFIIQRLLFDALALAPYKMFAWTLICGSLLALVALLALKLRQKDL